MFIPLFRKLILACGLCGLIGNFAYAESGDAPPHYENNCITCHTNMIGGDGNLLYQRKDRMVNDLPALRKRVAFCQQSLKLDWSEQQIKEVVEYLNQEFYGVR